MSNRFPPWIVALCLVLLSLGSIWGVGKALMSADGADAPRVSLPAETPVADDGLAEPTPKPTPPNTAFPDFSGATVDGHTFHLSDVRGKVVLINYWATWCGPCRAEIPDLISLQKKYGPRGFVVVGLSEDKDVASPAAFARQSGMTYPVLQTPDTLRQAIGVDGLPTSILLNRQGMVVRAISGVSSQISPAAMWSPEIEKLL